ncbi:hypothetical protein JCM8097_007743 [Rhodosporidiobolus ruineniae]
MSFAALPPSLASLSPTFHQRFEVIEEVGVGGSGFCLKVRRRADGKEAVAKCIPRNRLASRGLVRTAHWGSVPEGYSAEADGTLVVPVEAYVLRRVRHSSVVSFIDLFACPTFHYLIMAYHGSTWRIETHEQPSYLPSPPITPPAHFATFPRTASDPEPESTDPAAPVARRAIAVPPAPLMRRSSSDLFDCVERFRHFSEDIARHIFSQIVAAVYDLAKMGIAHADLKDENIVIASDCRVKLVDFGSCVMFDPRGPAPIQHEARFYGTCTYAAPEVLAGHAYSLLLAEVYSLGVLLSVLLTGEHPFFSPADAAAGKRLPLKVPVSDSARDLLDRCLTADLNARISLFDLRRHPWVVGPSPRS